MSEFLFFFFFYFSYQKQLLLVLVSVTNNNTGSKWSGLVMIKPNEDPLEFLPNDKTEYLQPPNNAS